MIKYLFYFFRDLSDSGITSLPTIGLGQITELALKQTPSLKHFPSVLEFKKIEKAELHYPHHCCAFKNPEKQDPEKYRLAQERINRQCAQTTTIAMSPPPLWQPVIPVITSTVRPLLDVLSTLRNHFPFNLREKRSFGDTIEPSSQNMSMNDYPIDTRPGFGSVIPNKGIGVKIKQPDTGGFHPSTLPVNETITHVFSCGEIYFKNRHIDCTPEPDAFNPCEDVMGYFWLRITVWFVLLAALLGNSVVLLVLITSRSKFTVPKFLMCNLAFADFFMGVYLLLLASIDVRTLGEYFNYAVQWQNEGGCQAAGFLSVFSSELSIFTLTIITLERWYAISHAIHLNKRLKLRQSLLLMLVGFIFASALAILPLAGISGYGNVSICLPMKADNIIDIGYIVSLLIMNGLMFLAVCFCYVNMYWKVRSGSDCTARSNDATIAKRMALLVFTNFACWAPIAFFGLTASAGHPLIDITNSKILLVFFYPLNSCANPFLYAILTKQFRKDVFIFLGRYGICVDKANMYRGTHTSRSMSHSKGGKDMILHSIAHPNESLFSQLMDSNHSSKHSVNSTPKVHPKSSPHVLDVIQSSFTEKNHLQRAADFANKDQNLTGDDSSPNEKKTQSTTTKRENKKDCPPYMRVRSVSDYMTLNKTGNGNGIRSAPRQQVSVETYVSSSTDTTYFSESSHGNIEDIWQIREDVDENELQHEQESDQCLQSLLKSQQNGFNCVDYSSAEEVRLSQKNCYMTCHESDFDDDENVFKHLLHNESKPGTQVNKMSMENNKSPVRAVLNSRYRFARSPSLSSLEETAENNLLCFRHSSSSSYGKDLDLLQNDAMLKLDKSKESGFHSSTSIHEDIFS